MIDWKPLFLNRFIVLDRISPLCSQEVASLEKDLLKPIKEIFRQAPNLISTHTGP